MGHANRISVNADSREELLRITEVHIGQVKSFCTGKEKTEELVHELRKLFKRIRANLRLMREDIGYSAYYRENQLVKQLHQELSGSRDREVMVESIKNISDLIDNEDLSSALQSLADNLAHDIGREGGSAEPRKLKEIVTELDQMLERLKTYGRSEVDFAVYASGLKRLYRQARRELSLLTRKGPDLVTIHNFRKRAKYLMYQLDMLRPIFKKVLKGMVRSLDDMTDKLGMCRDLKLARDYIIQHLNIPAFTLKEIRSLEDRMDDYCNNLLSDALRTGKKLFAEHPDNFVNRIEQYWMVARETEQ